MKIALLFPGQGAQAVGMGKDFYDTEPEVRSLFEQASDELGFDLARLCFEGPEEELKKTQNTQPALLTVEYAIFTQLARQFDLFSAAAGHSLGEYTALTAAGSFAFTDAVKTVRKRGEFMSRVTDGSLVACMGLSDDQVWSMCKELSADGVISPALFNSPGQTVVAGQVPVLEKFIDKCSEMQGVRATMLKVSGPFHCSLLDGAAEEFSTYLDGVTVNAPRFPVIANVTGEPSEEPGQIRQNLVSQIRKPVLWTRCVENLKTRGYNTFVEIGPGRVLKGLLRKTDRDLKVLNIAKKEDIDKVIPELRKMTEEKQMESET